MAEALAKRQEAILAHVEALNKRVHTLRYISDVQKRVAGICEQLGLSSVSFVRAPSDYYEWQLQDRQKYIGAPSTHHLCKSIILENTECTEKDCSDPENSRFYCIIIQYTARLSSQKLFKYVRTLKQNQIPLKNYHFQLANDSENLTGFEHNAVCPVGMRTPIPIIISNKILTVDFPKYIWLGGGEVDVKMGINVKELSKMAPHVYFADVTQEDDVEAGDFDE
eukprot:Phypoly_transcript_17266.p1 GENE.Phypoly_transcript_17266~~Phypoly_transcript_17266.p1  ORF type:complete len:223 (+),score=16.97 Phypoly_transcript_17266:127-795(+)